MHSTPAIDELCDRIEWITKLVAMKTARTDAERMAALTTVADMQARLANRGSPLHSSLRDRLALSETELQVVWLLAAAALDDRVRDHLAVLGTLPMLGRDSLRRVIYGAEPTELGLIELGPAGRLRGFGLIERGDGQSVDTPESRWSWALSYRVLSWLHGSDSLDPALQHALRIPGDLPSLSTLAASEAAVTTARHAIETPGVVLVASGKPALGRRTLLAAVARDAGTEVLYVDCARLEREPAGLAQQLRAIARECRLLARVPLLANIDVLADEAAPRTELVGRELVANIEGLVMATCGPHRPALRWNRPSIVVELEPPTSAQRVALWQKTLPQMTEDVARTLASVYPVAPALVADAARAAQAQADGEEIATEHVAAGIRSVLDDRLGHLAQRVSTKQRWDDVVLPEDQRDAVQDFIARVRERARVLEDWEYGRKLGSGLGLCALFSGPPGTGKTMVAGLVARELRLEIYRVDLARVVSKWIGESEKNLAALFDAAEAGHAILLFDEADSLFGKRTEVKSSNDRYANLETNYLLQRIETFTGICILTSNHETNIDPAFQRRMTLHVRFEMPDERERAQLWRALIPAAAPLDVDVDFRRLARGFEMAGGAIRNASLRAAFSASAQNSAITMAHLERAARLEYEALGKIVTGDRGL